MHSKTCLISPETFVTDRSKVLALMLFDFVWLCGAKWIGFAVPYGLVAVFMLILYYLALWSSPFGKRELIAFLSVQLYAHCCILWFNLLLHFLLEIFLMVSRGLLPWI